LIFERGGERLLLTGGSGFIGLRIGAALARHGFHDVSTAYDSAVPIDLSSWPTTKRYVLSCLPDIVINCAAKRPQSSDAHKYGHDVNHAIVQNLVRALEITNKRVRFLQMGSSEEYSKSDGEITEFSECRPQSDYGKGKLRSTNFLTAMSQDSPIEPVILRPSTVYGRGQRLDMLIPLICEAVHSGTKVRIDNPFAVRDFLHVDDLAAACIIAMDREDAVGEIFNVSSGNPVAVSGILAKVAEISGKPVDSFADLPATTPILPLGDRLDISPRKIQTVFGWSASRDLAAGLRQLFSVY
jgi:UDP-glucose 4-epimerase